MSDTAFHLKDVKKGFVSREGSSILALEAVSLQAMKGEITCLVGPTASGKTTVLRCLAGLEDPDDGEIKVDGGGPSGRRGKIGYLTQRHTLFPWMRVRENMELPLKIRGVQAGLRRQRVKDLSDAMGLAGALDLYPYELSGGMQQRAALGRLLASEAPYWLMDEPFSNLDERTQHHLQRLLLRLLKEHRLSVLFVTHSIDEAVFLSDSIVVLSAGPGRVVEILRPEIPVPRDRLSPEYGRLMERIRRSIETVLA